MSPEILHIYLSCTSTETFWRLSSYFCSFSEFIELTSKSILFNVCKCFNCLFSFFVSPNLNQLILVLSTSQLYFLCLLFFFYCITESALVSASFSYISDFNTFLLRNSSNLNKLGFKRLFTYLSSNLLQVS